MVINLGLNYLELFSENSSDRKISDLSYLMPTWPTFGEFCDTYERSVGISDSAKMCADYPLIVINLGLIN